MPLINCKVKLSLTWDPNPVLSTLAGASTLTIIDCYFISRRQCKIIKTINQRV